MKYPVSVWFDYFWEQSAEEAIVSLVKAGLPPAKYP